jgi:hypothetical protein
VLFAVIPTTLKPFSTVTKFATWKITPFTETLVNIFVLLKELDLIELPTNDYTLEFAICQVISAK